MKFIIWRERKKINWFRRLVGIVSARICFCFVLSALLLSTAAHVLPLLLVEFTATIILFVKKTMPFSLFVNELTQYQLQPPITSCKVVIYTEELHNQCEEKQRNISNFRQNRSTHSDKILICLFTRTMCTVCTIQFTIYNL